MMRFKLGMPRRVIVRGLLAVALALQALAIVIIVGRERAAQRADRARVSATLNPEAEWTEYRARPILDPPILEASSARMGPDEAVIGVEIDNHFRAYCLAAMERPDSHLVSDRIGSTPVLVTYCNLNRCVRVYVDPKGSGPLDAEMVGLLNGEMVLALAGTAYFQDSGRPMEPGKDSAPVPYPLLTPTLATWKAWRRLHPGTDVYTGRAEPVSN
jgi:hypothetical protein